MAEVSNSNLFQIDTGILKKNACVVIIRTEWNAAIVNELEAGCVRQFRDSGMLNIKVVTVPGAFEIPYAIKSYWEHAKKKERPAAFVALGCVLRGDTPHFDYVCKAVTDGVVQLNLSLPVPVIFGVLTVDNQQQAEERIGGRHGHKGEEAAITAMKMLLLEQSFRKH
jgi:6,7-dimethyl-8-ribityllumazine synthase